jgi:hypothetical protein
MVCSVVQVTVADTHGWLVDRLSGAGVPLPSVSPIAASCDSASPTIVGGPVMPA